MTEAAHEEGAVRRKARVFITGGAGDLGKMVGVSLVGMGEEPVAFDLKPLQVDMPVEVVTGSVLDRPILSESVKGSDVIVHIAAWHGIHEHRQEKDAYEFWDLNATGTFNVFQAAADHGVKNVVFISSTSVDEPYSIYGNSKILGEKLAEAYSQREKMNVIILRPRAFIPPWNKHAYKDFLEWAKWFWTGAVHISDVSQSVIKSIELLMDYTGSEPLFHTLNVDGAYQYTDEELDNWDADGAGTTFKKHYAQFYDMAVKLGLDPTVPPKKIDMRKTQEILNYAPRYSLKTLLLELNKYGVAGPYVDRA